MPSQIFQFSDALSSLRFSATPAGLKPNHFSHDSVMRRRLLDLTARKFGQPQRAARLHQFVHEGGFFHRRKIRIGHSPEFSADDGVPAIRRNRMLRRSHQHGLALLERTGHWIRMISASPAPA
jgi:hypothetical protein